MAKHVTFFKMQVKPGKIDELVKVMSEGSGLDRAKKAGWTGSVVGASKNDPNELWGCVTWDNSDNYYKNAESPQQNESYLQMRELLTSDPEWHDADVVEEQFA